MAYSSAHTDVMLDLFSRLTVKELHCCKCVSKDWSCIISNHNLRPLHRRHWRRHPLFLVIDNVHSSRYTITVSEMDGTMLNQLIIDLPVTSSFQIIGYTFNELICFSVNQKHLYVCNPSTQELAAVPLSPFSSRFSAPFPPMGIFSFTKQQPILAIGRVPSLDQYKIVHLFVRRDGNDDRGLGCEVFTITHDVEVYSGSWMMIGDCPCSVSSSSHACVGQAVYWPVSDQAHRNRKNHILRLDLGTHLFDFLSGPEDYPYGGVDGEDFLSFALHELKGCLCLANSYQPSFELDIWMLENPGRGNGNWVKAYRIDLPPLDQHCMIQGFIPSNDDDDGSLVIFIPSNQGYYFYNIRTDTFSVADNLNAEGLHSYFVYYENFFSLGVRWIV